MQNKVKAAPRAIAWNVVACVVRKPGQFIQEADATERACLLAKEGVLSACSTCSRVQLLSCSTEACDPRPLLMSS